MAKPTAQVRVKYLTEDERREWGKKSIKQIRRIERKQKYEAQGREN